MTLSRFFRDYVYIPLGGNRRSMPRSYFNILVTFIIGGIWHGAGWLFMLWGFLHGIANMISRWAKTLNIKLNMFVAWFLTFNFINLTWVIFRSKDMGTAMNILSSMFDLSKKGSSISSLAFLFILAGFVITLGFKNSNEITQKVTPSYRWAALIGLLFGLSMLFMTRRSEFLYFQF